MTSFTPSAPEDTTVSALTIARGRAAHLRNVILGLTRQTRQPDELVIGVMQDTLYNDLPQTDFPIRQIQVTGEELPLARARNTVAEKALGDCLVFLDVDCIPAPELIAEYMGYARPGNGLIMGEVNYLPAGTATEGWDYAGLEAVAVRHSDRQGPPAEGLKRCNDYRCFWSLNFAIHREDWNHSGGFDERFTGYGGEDTDFGRELDERGVAIHWAKGAKVFHQHHPHCMPPIHHIPSILRNTEIFAEKWGHRTMNHWLTAFRLMGLVGDDGDALVQLREPDVDDFALCEQQSDQPYANTARILRYLRGEEQIAAE